MLEKEYHLKRAELDVRFQESKLREARKNCEIAEARMKLEVEKELVKLKAEIQREEINLKREINYLEYKRSESEFKS